MHTAERLGDIHMNDTGRQRKAADLVLTGLLAEPAQPSESEACWIHRRIAELQGWSLPEDG